MSTFLRSLDVPWPTAFSVAMARVNIINVNLVTLPKAACMHPNIPYYRSFNGEPAPDPAACDALLSATSTAACGHCSH